MEFNIIAFLGDLSKLFVETIIGAPNKILYILIGYKLYDLSISAFPIELCFENFQGEMDALKTYDLRFVHKSQEIYEFIKQINGD